MAGKAIAIIDVNVTIERIVEVQANQPEAAEEDVKRLIDLLADLQQLLSRYA